MIQNAECSDWTAQFQIQSAVDLDFVMAQQFGWPVGTARASPPEFRRRVIAAAISYQAGLSSIDYTLKHYVASDLYDNNSVALGDIASDVLRNSLEVITRELRELSTKNNLTFGRFGAEIALFKFPHLLDSARMLANRGLLLDVSLILRLSLEMISWGVAVFHIECEADVVRTRAQSCISQLRPIYESVGHFYGYLSRFSHWEHHVHSAFLAVNKDQVAVISASRQHRAISLVLCLVILDIFVEVIRATYLHKSNALVISVQGVPDRVDTRRTHEIIARIVNTSGLMEVRKLQSFLR